MRDFHLTFTFHLGGHVIPGETLPRTITVRPESTSIRYVYDSFCVCETWFAALHDTGAVVTLQLESSEPVAIEASFTPDVAWMWPAGLGAGYVEWDSTLRVFNFGEEEHRFYAVAGSPEAGRIPHEVPQTVSLVPWFKLYPYGLASADATPLYIIGTADYVRASGDLAFAGAKWDSLWRAYQWLRSTYEANGFAKNQGIGHGWIEGGPLLPVSSEL